MVAVLAAPLSRRRGANPCARPRRPRHRLLAAARRSALQRRRAPVDGVPAAGTRNPFAGHDGGAAFGRPQPLHHRDGQSLRARDGVGADDACDGRGRRHVGGLAGDRRAGGHRGRDDRRTDQRIRDRLSRRLADSRDARHDDDVQGPVDRPHARQRHLRLSRSDRLSRQRNADGRARGAVDLPRALRAGGGAAQQEPVRSQDLHDRVEREGDALFRSGHQARAARASICSPASSPSSRRS